MRNVLAFLMSLLLCFIAVISELAREPVGAAQIGTSCIASSGLYFCGGTSGQFNNCSPTNFNAPLRYPDVCFTPYAYNSVWNSANALTATVSPSSSTWQSYYTAHFPFFTQLEFGYTSETNQYQHPLYFGHSSDPVNSVSCQASWDAACVGSQTFHIPSYAVPAGGGDGHIGVIDLTNNMELDCWSFTSLTGGVLTAQSCISGLATTGTGLSSTGDAIATGAGYALWAGVIRAQELIQGQINHALFIVAPCTQDSTVYPSVSRTTDTQCTSNQGAPYGAWFRLNMTYSQVLALGVPSWKIPIYMALINHGGFIADTNGNQHFSLQTEADEMYTAAGYSNPNCPTNGAPCTPLTAYFHTLGDPGWNGSRYVISLSEMTTTNWNTSGQWLNHP